MEGKQEVAAGVRRWWVKNFVFVALIGALLFVTSGEVAWGMAWGYLAAVIVIVLANALVMDPALRAERSELQEGTKGWDVPLAIFVAIVGPVCTWAIAGLDVRFGWSEVSPPSAQMAALAVFVLGSFVTTWAMASNRFFSSTVRIQNDRGHHVAAAGPYRYVRHPGYTGGILAMLATPLALGSWVALIPGGLVAVAYILRTAWEDRALLAELQGYKEYAERVRSLPLARAIRRGAKRVTPRPGDGARSSAVRGRKRRSGVRRAPAEPGPGSGAGGACARGRAQEIELVGVTWVLWRPGLGRPGRVRISWA